ncbi:MAG: hypothetical protein ACREXK_14020 [Gammaproteobacteria bacterium]
MRAPPEIDKKQTGDVMNAGHVENFLTAVVRWRHAVIALGALLIVACLFAAMQLRKDTSADAFLDPDNPALRYRKQVADVFGLKDPVVIAVRRADGIFNPSTLRDKGDKGDKGVRALYYSSQHRPADSVSVKGSDPFMAVL